jgi:hypothetical protein
VDRKRREIELLRGIGAAPNDREKYLAAVQFYKQNGMKQRAAAVETEMRRRFGLNRSMPG